MTASRGLFVRQTGTAPNAVGTTPLEGRLALAGLVAEQSPGVPRNGLLFQSAAQLVTASTTDMSFNISACNPVINRATNEGVYVFSLTGTTNVASIAAPGTGLSRYDLVYVKMDDPDKGDPDNLPVVGVVNGAAVTGTPTKPYASVPAGGYVIAEELVVSGTATMSGAGNSLTQVWQHTATRGAPIPVLSQTDRDAITKFNGLTVRRLDVIGTPIETTDGTAWVACSTTPPPPDGSWSVVGGLFRTYLPGMSCVTATMKVTRTGTATATINQTFNALLSAFLPVGWRPNTAIQAMCVMSTTGGVWRGDLECLFDTNGNVAFRVSSGSIALAQNDVFYLQGSWWM